LIISVVNTMLYAVELVSRIVIDLVCLFYLVINFFSMSSRYFRTFDLAALICFIINDFFCFSIFLFSSLFNRQEDS
jgi:hypothetical protein